MIRVTRPPARVIPAHADAGRVGYELARTPEPKEGVDERSQCAARWRSFVYENGHFRTSEEQAGIPGG